MSILSQTGKIILVRQPVNGRFGIHRLMAMLSSNQFGVSWNGTEEITIVTFNAKRTICKILKYEISYFKIFFKYRNLCDLTLGIGISIVCTEIWMRLYDRFIKS